VREKNPRSGERGSRNEGVPTREGRVWSVTDSRDDRLATGPPVTDTKSTRGRPRAAPAALPVSVPASVLVAPGRRCRERLPGTSGECGPFPEALPKIRKSEIRDSAGMGGWKFRIPNSEFKLQPLLLNQLESRDLPYPIHRFDRYVGDVLVLTLMDVPPVADRGSDVPRASGAEAFALAFGLDI
jgi:hypothetical protein